MTTTILVAVAITLLALGAGAVATTVGPWYRALNKPTWNPPDWAFGPAWTLILSLTAWAGVLAWTAAPDGAAHLRIAILFGINLALYLTWSPLFFNLRRPDLALIEVAFLWTSILALILGLSPYSQTAGWLLVPYLLWVSFAAFLNFTIVRMNPSFRRAAARAA